MKKLKSKYANVYTSYVCGTTFPLFLCFCLSPLSRCYYFLENKRMFSHHHLYFSLAEAYKSIFKSLPFPRMRTG